jgi:hypothetical protein
LQIVQPRKQLHGCGQHADADPPTVVIYGFIARLRRRRHARYEGQAISVVAEECLAAEGDYDPALPGNPNLAITEDGDKHRLSESLFEARQGLAVWQ